MAKWAHEIILENMPPFSWLPRGWNVLLQLILMEIGGTLLALFLNLPTQSIIFGSLAIFIVSIWSFLIYHIGVTIHKMEPPSAPLEKKVVKEYQDTLFNPRHYEMYLGFAVFSFLVAYLVFFGQNLVNYWLGGKISPAPLFLIGLVLWDLSYRLGVGLWSAAVAFRRSVNFLFVYETRPKMRYTAYRELNILKQMDKINFVFGLVTLLLYPLFSNNLLLFTALTVYSGGILFFSAASLLAMERIYGFPHEAVWLLEECKVAFIGTSDRKMQPHLTPVIFVFVGNSLFFITSKVTKKLKNIRENPEIAFLVDFRDENNLYNNRAVLFTGKAKVYNIFTAALNLIKLIRVQRAFYKKYPEYMREYKKEERNLPLAWRTTIFVSRIPIEVQTEKIVYWREARAIKLPLGE
ncbi:MAG TPA: pyridoxamine 5'-phosphate oxidase family protein [Candidatus Binatia bacterium]|nr:pyridoxamine 5'-phosphate oxidase family protein [Candidatus Binatia bacterium]